MFFRAILCNFFVCLAVACGMNPVTAIQIATINAARIYRLYDLGAVAAGYRADLVVLRDLEHMEVLSVYKDGQKQPEAAAIGLIGGGADAILHSVRLAPVMETSFATARIRHRYPGDPHCAPATSRQRALMSTPPKSRRCWRRQAA